MLGRQDRKDIALKAVSCVCAGAGKRLLYPTGGYIRFDPGCTSQIKRITIMTLEKLSKEILDQITRLEIAVHLIQVPTKEEIVGLVIQTMCSEQRRLSEKVLVTQNEANQRYGKNVIRSLRNRRILKPYKFDTKSYFDSDGEEVTVSKGTIYYRLSDIEDALEKGNVIAV